MEYLVSMASEEMAVSHRKAIRLTGPYSALPLMAGTRLGKSMRFVFRNFPLTSIHPHAFHAAEAAESVAAHAGEKAFWCMHDAIYERPEDSPLALADESLGARR